MCIRDSKNYEWVDVYTLLQNDEEIPLPRINWLNSPFTLRFSYYDYSVVTETNPTPEEHTFELDARMTGIIKPDKNDFTFSYGTYVDIKWVKQFIKDNKKLLEDLGSVPKLDSYDNVYVKARSVDEVSTVLKLSLIHIYRTNKTAITPKPRRRIRAQRPNRSAMAAWRKRIRRSNRSNKTAITSKPRRRIRA